MWHHKCSLNNFPGRLQRCAEIIAPNLTADSRLANCLRLCGELIALKRGHLCKQTGPSFIVCGTATSLIWQERWVQMKISIPVRLKSHVLCFETFLNDLGSVRWRAASPRVFEIGRFHFAFTESENILGCFFHRLRSKYGIGRNWGGVWLQASWHGEQRKRL